MYTEPKIITSNDLTKRSYITFYFNDKRIREYNANNLGQRINPNRANTIEERNTLLRNLQFELHKALESGPYPLSEREPNSSSISERHLVEDKTPKEPSAEDVLKFALTRKLSADLNRKYKRNLKVVHRDFIGFLSTKELSSPLPQISRARVEEFLSGYGSTGTYYMNVRRDLGVLFNTAAAMLNLEVKTIAQSERRRVKAKLNKAYEKSQLKPLLNFLAEKHPNLHLCCLLTYSSWLRPHEEIRLLRPYDFAKEYTEIHLSGDSNKSGKVRVVHVPEYVRSILCPIIQRLKTNDNIFTGCISPYNEDYFNTQWNRLRPKLIQKGLIKLHQTIYSFRHTAAIEVYRRTKDVYLLQKLLGHSSIAVTLKYLRSLGEFNSDELREAAPQLEF